MPSPGFHNEDNRCASGARGDRQVKRWSIGADSTGTTLIVGQWRSSHGTLCSGTAVANVLKRFERCRTEGCSGGSGGFGTGSRRHNLPDKAACSAGPRTDGASRKASSPVHALAGYTGIRDRRDRRCA